MSPALTLKKYITDEKGNRQGVIIAGFINNNPDGEICVGWSLINSNHNDEYDNFLAHRIAYGRVSKGSGKVIPQRIKEEVIKMATRAGAYFKKSNILIAGIIVDNLDEYRKQQSLAAKNGK